MFDRLRNKYVIGCPSCDNIPDIECSLAFVVDVMPFFGSKFFSTDFFAIITFNLSKAFCCSSNQINSTFFFLKSASGSVRSVYFGTYTCRNSSILKKIQVLFLFGGVAIFSIFSMRAWSGDITSFEME